MKTPTIDYLLDLMQDYSMGFKSGFASRADMMLFIRKHLFVPKQKIKAIRKWFILFPYITLTDSELKVVKSIVVKPKKTYWDILTTIMLEQKQMTGKQISTWFKDINIRSNGDRSLVFISVIKDRRVTDDNLKINLFKELLGYENYYIEALDMLDDEIVYDEPIWEKLLVTLVDIINEESTDSVLFAKYWSKHTMHFDLISKKMNFVSPLLFKYTGLNQYLPKEARDVFIF